MSSDALLDRMVQSPRLGLYVGRLTEVLAEEGRRRELFYDTMKEGAKQEFINGEVVVHSPVTSRHERASSLLFRALSAYVDRQRLGRVAHEKLLVSLTRNDYEPDICFFSNQKAKSFQPAQMQFPAPGFIAEVLSASTAGVDRGAKFDDYAAHSVGEYWIVDPDAELVEQYVLEGDQYALKLKMNSGLLASSAVEGFAVPVRAIFDEQENLAALRKVLGPGA